MEMSYRRLRWALVTNSGAVEFETIPKTTNKEPNPRKTYSNSRKNGMVKVFCSLLTSFFHQPNNDDDDESISEKFFNASTVNE